MARSGSWSAATGASGLLAVATNPSGTRVMASPWLDPHLAGSGQSTKMGDVPVIVSGVRPYSPRPVRADVTTELLREELGPLTDPRIGIPGSYSRGRSSGPGTR